MTSLRSLTDALNDDCIRVIMLCLPVPDATSFSSTCAKIRKLLDQTTLTALVKMSIPTSLATRLFSGTLNLDHKEVYRDFALKLTGMSRRPVPTLADFAFSVRCWQSGATQPWFECEAEAVGEHSIKLSFPPNVVEQLTFHVKDVDEYREMPEFELEYDVLVTDLRTGRSRLVATFSDIEDADVDYDGEKGEIYYFELQHLSQRGGEFFDQGDYSDSPAAIHGSLHSIRMSAGKRKGYVQQCTRAFTGLRFSGFNLSEWGGETISLSDTLRLVEGIAAGAIDCY